MQPGSCLLKQTIHGANFDVGDKATRSSMRVVHSTSHLQIDRWSISKQLVECSMRFSCTDNHVALSLVTKLPHADNHCNMAGKKAQQHNSYPSLLTVRMYGFRFHLGHNLTQVKSKAIHSDSQPEITVRKSRFHLGHNLNQVVMLASSLL